MDFQDLAIRLGIDEEDVIELVELFVTTTRDDIEKIKNGLIGNNAQDAAAASHSIKGAAGNLGFDDMAELAKKLEIQAKTGSLDGMAELVSNLEVKLDALAGD